MATQNPIEYEGTFALPEAQLDRFLVRLRLGYPDRSQERAIARRYREDAEPLERVPRVLDAPAVLALREHVRGLHVSEEVEGYIVALAVATREDEQLQLGASPRATVALYRAAQAWAFLDGRDFVLPDDVKAIAQAVLAHRIVVDLDQGLRGATPEGVLEELLERVAVPPVLDGADEPAAVDRGSPPDRGAPADRGSRAATVLGSQASAIAPPERPPADRDAHERYRPRDRT
jgi:MoxR-like ATPase